MKTARKEKRILVANGLTPAKLTLAVSLILIFTAANVRGADLCQELFVVGSWSRPHGSGTPIQSSARFQTADLIRAYEGTSKPAGESFRALLNTFAVGTDRYIGHLKLD